MSKKITIIEGPTPVFQEVRTLWGYSLTESHLQYDVVATELRAFDGDSLVGRCHSAWKNHETINLEYRNNEGLPDKLPIVAAFSKETEEGDILQLWLRIEREDIEIEIEYDDGLDDDDFDMLF